MFNGKFWNNPTERFTENKVTIKEYIIVKIDEFLNTSTLTPYRVLTRCKRNEIEDLMQELYQKAPPGRLAEYVWNHFENVDSSKTELVKLSMLLASIGEEVDKNRDLIFDEKRSDEVLPLLERRADQPVNFDQSNQLLQRPENAYNSLAVTQKLEPSAFEENDGYPIPELTILSPTTACSVSYPTKSAPFRRTFLKTISGALNSIPSSSSSTPMRVILPRPSKINAEVNNQGSLSSTRNIRRSQRNSLSISGSKPTLINQKDDYVNNDDDTVATKHNVRKGIHKNLPKRPRRKDAVVGGLYNAMNGYHTSIRRINEKIQKPKLSSDDLEKYKAELNEVKNNLEKGVLQRTLNNKAKKLFSPIMNQRILDGFVTYEAAVEFINHEDSGIREIMQTVLNETVINDSNFWMNAISSRIEWYKSFLDLKKYKLFETERSRN